MISITRRGASVYWHAGGSFPAILDNLDQKETVIMTGCGPELAVIRTAIRQASIVALPQPKPGSAGPEPRVPSTITLEVAATAFSGGLDNVFQQAQALADRLNCCLSVNMDGSDRRVIVVPGTPFALLRSQYKVNCERAQQQDAERLAHPEKQRYHPRGLTVGDCDELERIIARTAGDSGHIRQFEMDHASFDDACTKGDLRQADLALKVYSLQESVTTLFGMVQRLAVLLKESQQ